MKYPIENEATEQIELNVQDERFSLIHRVRSEQGSAYSVIIMNKREALKLYQAIGEEIPGLNKR